MGKKAAGMQKKIKKVVFYLNHQVLKSKLHG
jgi:hypothetical protein